MIYKFQKSVIYLSIIVIAIGFVFLANGLILAWTGPTLPPPDGNASAPINISGTAQTKSGSFTSLNIGIGAAALANNRLYVYRPSGDYGSGKSGIYSYRYGTGGATNGGFSWNYSQIDAAIKGYSYWGNNYTAGVAGYNYLDYPKSAGVLGANNNGSIRGMLGYKDDAYKTWAGYFVGDVNIGGKVSAQYYCDQNASNCKTATQMGGTTCNWIGSRLMHQGCDGDGFGDHWIINGVCTGGVLSMVESKPLDEYCVPGVPCFVAGTKVTMADGSLKNIENIKIGEQIKGKQGENTVLDYERHKVGSRKSYIINDKVEFMGDHPFLSTEGWKVTSLEEYYTALDGMGVRDTADLKPTKLEIGDILLTENGQEEVKTIKRGVLPADETVYDFKLDGDHTYIADGFVVRTCTDPSGK